MIARPFVTANFAVTLDGRISTRKFTPSDFSSPRDKRRLLEIRAGCDAVLAGVRTLAADGMSAGLPAGDLRAARVRRGRPPHPLRVAVSNSGLISPRLRFFTADLPIPVLFTTKRMPSRAVVELAGICDIYLHLSREVNLVAVLATLREDYGVKRVVCEGGGALLRSLLAEDLVDELNVTLCPRIFGGIGAPTLTGVAGEFLPRATRLRLVETVPVANECFTRWRVIRTAP